MAWLYCFALPATPEPGPEICNQGFKWAFHALPADSSR